MDYVYPDSVRQDILKMVPADGCVIGSIGCSYGATEAELVKQGRQVHGIDINGPAVEVARTRLTSARLVDSQEQLYFEPASLDGLILADVIEHMPMAWEALARMAKSVRPGGWIAISVPNMRSFRVAHRFFWGGDWPEDPTGIFDATHIQVMSHRRLERWCANSGLRVERWFPRYNAYGPRRELALRACDIATLGLFHTWWLWQIQCLCRTRG